MGIERLLALPPRARPAAPVVTPGRYWLEPRSSLLARLSTTDVGLEQAEATRRLTRYGRNTLVGTGRPRLASRIARRLTEPLIAILLVAAILAGMVGDPTSSAIIIFVVALSTTLDLIQEQKAERTADALRQSVAVKVDVWRDSRQIEVLCEEVVPGDVVSLKAGDLVPADGIVLASSDAHANETILTGEAYPAEKREGFSRAQSTADAFDALFAGTTLTSGSARMLVVATGDATILGGIAGDLAEERPPTAFERGIHRLGFLIMRLTVLLSLFVLLMQLASHRPPLEAFLFAIALAVGLTPELLPMVMTVTLARGALRMAERKVVVKRLSAIHDLGALDVLCTDKTGTLTEARIGLAGHAGLSGQDSPRVLELAAINARFESGVRSALNDAILAHAGPGLTDAWAKIAEKPFDFERRRISVLVRREDTCILVVKGAAEQLLELCSRAELADGRTQALDRDTRERVEAMQAALAEKGQRLLGVAWREMPANAPAVRLEDEQDLVFAGFCAFVDPPKVSAASAKSSLAAAGVRTKIISGDDPRVVRHLVEILRLPMRGCLSGTDIEQLNDHALAAAVEATDIYCRVSPDQKTRVVRALKARGHTVGFVGDGINDAPAIRAADVGISVEGAADVAREAADMILLEADLGVLAAGIAEGRRTFANILKYVRMVTSSNLGNMLSMALASLWLPFLPLTPVQILINNFLYDASEIGIPFDKVEPKDLELPQTWDMAGILRFMLVLGPVSSIFDFATFLLLRDVFSVSMEQFRTAWFVESMATQILVIFVIRTARPAWQAWPHPVLATTSLVALGAAIALALTPIGHFVGFAGLSGGVLLALVLIIAGYLVTAELVKPLALRARRPG